MKKLPIYRVVPNESEIYGLSVVEDPAIERDFILLSKEEKKHIVCLESNEKHNILGAALIPDFPIYRRYGEEEFYVTFEKDTIEKLAHKFMKNGSQFNITHDHEGYQEGLYICETWLVSDKDNDKSNAYGLDLPLGSWVVMCHCSDIDLWESFKKGERNGFSIESFVQLEEIVENKEKNSQEEKMAKQEVEMNESFWERLQTMLSDALGKNKEEEVKTEEVKLEEEVKPEEVVDEVVETVENVDETTEEVTEDLQAVIDGLQAEVDALKAENEELKKKNEKMSKQPSTPKLEVKQSAQKQSAMDIIEALQNGTYFKK